MLLSAAKGFLWMYDCSAQLLHSNDLMIEDANRKDFSLILGESYVLVFYFKLQGKLWIIQCVLKFTCV